MIRLAVTGVGVCGPGMPDWSAATAVMRSAAPVSDELPKPAATILPPAERRRSGMAIRYALQVAQEATAQAGVSAADAAMVFASSDGDGENLHHILEALALPGREVSPTRFHNSVHNAAAGYWNIATGARMPANSVAAFDDSFAAGLLEAAVQAATEQVPVLLVAFDLPLPPPLHQARTVAAPFAVALLLTPNLPGSAQAHLHIRLAEPQDADCKMPQPELEKLRNGNAAARALPLLQAIACGQERKISLALGGSHLTVEVQEK